MSETTRPVHPFIHVEQDYPWEKINPKQLPRHPVNGHYLSSFTANGNIYYLMADGEGFPVSRYGWFQKFVHMYLSGADFTMIHQRLNGLLDTVNNVAIQQAKFSEIVVDLTQMISQNMKLSEQSVPFALYLASLWIIRADENVNDYQIAIAEQKIQDWAVEGFDINDFFILTTLYAERYIEGLMLHKMKAIEAALQADGVAGVAPVA